MKIRTRDGLSLDTDDQVSAKACDRIVLAYELADVMSDYAEQTDAAEPITIGQIVICFAMLQHKYPERKALSEFGKCYRLVRRAMKRYGDDCRLRDVLVEMHLDQRKERRG